METKNFTEKESLELIATIINRTKKNMGKGSGNVFLYYGYFTVTLGLIIFLLVYFTGLHTKHPKSAIPVTFGVQFRRTKNSHRAFTVPYQIVTLTPAPILIPGRGARYFRREFCGRAS